MFDHSPNFGLKTRGQKQGTFPARDPPKAGPWAGFLGDNQSRGTLKERFSFFCVGKLGGVGWSWGVVGWGIGLGEWGWEV